MGVTCSLATLSDANIERLLAEPRLVWCVVGPEYASHHEGERTAELPWLARLLGRRRSPPAPEPPPAPKLELSPGEAAVLDLDRVWTGVQLALTGVEWGGEPPLDFITSGGREIGNIDVGYGPARAFTSHETRGIADAVARLNEETIRRRFDPAEMTANGLDPSIWASDALDWAMDSLASLRQFLSDAVRQRHGFVIWF